MHDEKAKGLIPMRPSSRKQNTQLKRSIYGNMYGDYYKIATSYPVKTLLSFISWLITQNERVNFSKVKVAPKLLRTILMRIKEMITKQNGLEFIIMWIYR